MVTMATTSLTQASITDVIHTATVGMTTTWFPRQPHRQWIAAMKMMMMILVQLVAVTMTTRCHVMTSPWKRRRRLPSNADMILGYFYGITS